MGTRRILGNLVALVVAGVVSVTVGELVLRAFVTLPLRRTAPEVRYLPHPERRFTLMPGQAAYSYGAPVTVDDRGFRRNDAGDQARGEGPVVLALGDSFTFGLGVRDTETWPARLETRLRERAGQAVSVINSGTISYGVSQELDLLRASVSRLKPAIVVHGLYWNDFMTTGTAAEAPSVLTPDGYFVWDRMDDNRGVVRRLASWTSSRSAFLFSLRRLVSRATTADGTSAYGRAYDEMLERGLAPEEWRPIEEFYRAVLALGREHGFSTFVVILPVNSIVNRPRSSEHPFAVAARRYLDALGISYVDGFRLWEERGSGDRDLFLPQGPDAHLNPEGYRLVADAVADGLLQTASTADALRTPGSGVSSTSGDER
ncbi:MAG: SGNH/GDSL hydrolase family protein [Vicinamibacterales bacterium]